MKVKVLLWVILITGIILIVLSFCVDYTIFGIIKPIALLGGSLTSFSATSLLITKNQ